MIKDIDSHKELSDLYKSKFTLGYLGTNINNKFALISLLGYITYKIKKKMPTATHYDILKHIAGKDLPGLKGIAIVCEDFSYGCSEFPTFDIPDKEIFAKIKELMSSWTPF